MADNREAIRLIAGVEPTAEQLQRVQAIAHSLDIQQSDAMLPILIALDTYHGAFTRLPADCHAVANEVATAAGEQARTEVDKAVVIALQKIGPAFSKSLQEVVADVALKEKAIWFSVACALSCAALGLVWFIGTSSGYKAGYGDGYRMAQQESHQESCKRSR